MGTGGFYRPRVCPTLAGVKTGEAASVTGFGHDKLMHLAGLKNRAKRCA